MSLYHQLTEKLQYLTPKLYKERYFKNLKNISKDSYYNKNIEPELIWIKDFLNKDAVIFDIGANVGSFVYRLENKLSSNNIVAFEPNEKLYFRLKRIFPEIKIFPIALSDKNETAEFKIPVINGKTFHSRGTLQTDYKESGEEKHTINKVKVMKMDDWITTQNINRIDFIKIDVEGNEMKTLFGAKQTITKFQPTLMVEMEQRHHQQPLFEMISEVESWGFEANFLNRETFELEKLTEKIIADQNENVLINKKLYINNIIFVPKQPKTNS